MADILLNKEKGYYDFDFLDGDFALTDGLGTALLLSFLCEKRAAASEIPTPEFRRGWWGNTVLKYDNYEIGSKLWLLEQARKDNTTLNLAKTYTSDCLQWLISDTLVKEIKSESSFIVDGISVEADLVISPNKTLSIAFDLWENTNSF